AELALLRLRAQLARHGARVVGQRDVVRLARRAKERLDVVVLHPLDEPRVADRRLAALLDDLARDPLEVLARLLVQRQHVDAVLDRDGADLRQALADLGAEVRGLRWDRVDQEEPMLRRLLRRARHPRACIATVCFEQRTVHNCHYARSCVVSTARTMNRARSAAVLVVLGACSGSPDGASVSLPDAGPGIGFDDLQYSPTLHRVLVPGGRSGKLDLIDPGS